MYDTLIWKKLYTSDVLLLKFYNEHRYKNDDWFKIIEEA